MLLVLAIVVVWATAGIGCGGGSPDHDLHGTIRIDGSEAVAPLTRMVARHFELQNPGIGIEVGRSDTARGFARLCTGKAEIVDASRPIEPRERRSCDRKGAAPHGATVANQAIAVLLNWSNPKNCIRIEYLVEIWRPENPVLRWSEISNGDVFTTFKAQVRRFGPRPGSAAFNYFTETINRKEGAQTTAYAKARGNEERTMARVARLAGGIGYLDFTAFHGPSKGVKLAELESEDTGICVLPTPTSVQDGSYGPLSRELLIYVSSEALADSATKAFVDYYLEHAGEFAGSVGLVPLSETQLESSRAEIG